MPTDGSPGSIVPGVVTRPAVFPAEAFVHSAETAYDMSRRRFACHQSGEEKPATCAGSCSMGADHNLAIRLGRSHGRYLDVTNGGVELYDDYVEMAVANGGILDIPH